MSRKWLTKYRTFHTITKICERHATTVPRKERTIEWLVREYLSQWDKAKEARIVGGPRPQKRDVYHSLSLICQDAILLARRNTTALPMCTQVWIEFAKKARRERQSLPDSSDWGIYPDVGEIDFREEDVVMEVGLSLIAIYLLI